MNRISLHISSLVKHCNSVSKLILLVVLTGFVSSAFAQTTLNKNYTSGKTTITGNAQTVKSGDKPGPEDNKYIIQNDGTTVTIKGNLTIAPGTKLEISSGATLVVEGNLTLGDGTAAAELLLKNNSILVVKKNLILNDDAKFKINEGEKAGEGATVIVNGDLEINGETKEAEVIAQNSAKMIVEGNLVLSGSKNKIKVEKSASITIMKKISGTGKIEFPGPKNNAKKIGYFTVLEGLAEGTTMSNIKIEMPGSGNNNKEAKNLLYISGIGDLTIKDGDKEITINGSNTSSTAYITSCANIAEARAAGLLPIELVSFKATATNNGFEFNWVTASEENNDYFTLEYSINGVDFNEIDYVHGAGTTSETSGYEYRWDEAPEFDVVYFRLKQTDYNGEYTYSDVIAASRKKSSGANGTFRYGPLNLQIQDGELRYIQK